MSSLYRLRRQNFPNNEARLTLTRVPLPRDRQSPESQKPTLDISSEFGTTAPVKERKPTKFGTNARRSLLRAGGAMDRVSANPGENLMLTGTLPGSLPKALLAIAADAHSIVDRLNSWVEKRIKAPLRFHVWELQKRGALHLHYCVHVPDKAIHERIKSEFHEEWCRLLDMVGKHHHVNMYQRGFGDGRVHPKSAVQTNAQTCVKSVAGYFAKYASKTANRPGVRTEKFTPRRWWAQSHSLKSLVDSLTETVDVLYSSYQEAVTQFRKTTDAIAPASAVQFEYPHKCGVGMTSVSYYLTNLWKALMTAQINEQTLRLTPLQKLELQESLLIKRLKLVTENFCRYMRSPLHCRSATASSLMNSAIQRQSVALDADFGNVRAWARDILALSYSWTYSKMRKVLPPLELEEHSRLLRSLNRLEEARLYHGNKAWNCLLSCNHFLANFDSTNPPGATFEPSEDLFPSNRTATAPSLQLELPL